jgi:hypothetical protein
MSKQVMIDEYKLEILKVYYAIFTALIDGQNVEPFMTDEELPREAASIEREVEERSQ